MKDIDIAKELIAHVGCGDVDNMGRCMLCPIIRQIIRLWYSEKVNAKKAV